MLDIPPEVPPQHAPIVIAQASQAQDPAKFHRTIGVCHLIANIENAHLHAVNVLNPLRATRNYFSFVEHREVELAGKVAVLNEPEHGTLEMGKSGGRYHPALEYFGSDRAIFLVETGGYKIKTIYFFQILRGVPSGTDGYDPYEDKTNCPNGRYWRISLK